MRNPGHNRLIFYCLNMVLSGEARQPTLWGGPGRVEPGKAIFILRERLANGIHPRQKFRKVSSGI